MFCSPPFSGDSRERDRDTTCGGQPGVSGDPGVSIQSANMCQSETAPKRNGRRTSGVGRAVARTIERRCSHSQTLRAGTAPQAGGPAAGAAHVLAPQKPADRSTERGHGHSAAFGPAGSRRGRGCPALRRAAPPSRGSGSARRSGSRREAGEREGAGGAGRGRVGPRRASARPAATGGAQPPAGKEAVGGGPAGGAACCNHGDAGSPAPPRPPRGRAARDWSGGGRSPSAP